MNLRKRKIHRVSFHYWGWTARPFSLCLAVAGTAFALTSPFIERDYRQLENRQFPVADNPEIILAPRQLFDETTFVGACSRRNRHLLTR
jgi:hypothetical protein